MSVSETVSDTHLHLVELAKDKVVEGYRGADLAGKNPDPPAMPDARIQTHLATVLALMNDRGTTDAFVSPRAAAVANHVGDVEQNERWANYNNGLVLRACQLNPGRFIPVGMLGQSLADPLKAGLRCAAQMAEWISKGFTGFIIDPDLTGGMWNGGVSFTDKHNHPMFGTGSEADVPFVLHASESINPLFPHTALQYLFGDMVGFVHLMMHGRQLRKLFPRIRFIIPHGGGALGAQKGRWTALAKKNGWMTPDELMGEGIVFVDGCVYCRSDMEALFRAALIHCILNGSECNGAFPGVKNDQTGKDADDTKLYLDEIGLNKAERELVLVGNSRIVYPHSSKWRKAA